MKKTLAILSVLTAGTMFAETLITAKPGDYEQGVNVDNKDFIYKSSANGKTVKGKEKELAFVACTTGSRASYRIPNNKALSKDNFTVTVLARIKGVAGDARLLEAGAGSLAAGSQGFRFAVNTEKGRLTPYVLFVAPETFAKNPKLAKYVLVKKNPKINFEANKWYVLTLSANRTGDLQLFIDGELAGSKSIKQFENQELYPKGINFASSVYGNKKSTEAPIQMDIAEIIVKNELMSSSQIMKEAEKLLDKAEK